METNQLREAAQAVCDRWDSPDWKSLEHTGDFIRRLRQALDYDAHKPLEMPVYKTPHIGPIYAPNGGTINLYPNQYKALILEWHRKGWDERNRSA